MELQSRPYQDRAVDFLVGAGGNGIIRAGTGAGKTVIACKTIKKVGFKRLLILVPRYTALLAWKREIVRLGLAKEHELAVVQKWSKAKRLALWANPLEAKVVIVLYQSAVKDFLEISDDDSEFDYVVADESHRVQNRQTQTFKRLKVICRRRKLILLTATPQTKGAHNLWTSLHLLSPKVFKSYWNFVDRYCIVEEDEYGRKPTGVKKSTLPELKNRLKGFMFNITDKDTDGWVPKSVREQLTVQLDKKTGKIYHGLFTHLMAALPDGSVVVTPTTLSKYMEVRKLLCCPKLIHPALGIGAGFEAAIEHLEANDRHGVIFSDFVEQFPIWEKHLKKLGYPVYTIKGGMKLRDIELQIDSHARHKDDAVPSILLCSIGCAESFDILTPIAGYFVGFSWSQRANFQAEGRLTRGNKTHCNFFYMAHDNTVDTYMLEVLDENVRTTNITMRDYENYSEDA